MQSAGLDEAQAKIKIDLRNIKKPQIYRWHHPYDSKEELKSLLTKVKEESEKAGLKLNI